MYIANNQNLPEFAQLMKDVKSTISIITMTLDSNLVDNMTTHKKETIPHFLSL